MSSSGRPSSRVSSTPVAPKPVDSVVVVHGCGSSPSVNLGSVSMSVCRSSIPVVPKPVDSVVVVHGCGSSRSVDSLGDELVSTSVASSVLESFSSAIRHAAPVPVTDKTQVSGAHIAELSSHVVNSSLLRDCDSDCSSSFLDSSVASGSMSSSPGFVDRERLFDFSQVQPTRATSFSCVSVGLPSNARPQPPHMMRAVRLASCAGSGRMQDSAGQHADSPSPSSPYRSINVLYPPSTSASGDTATPSAVR